MKNSPHARTKTSRVEDIMNFQIITIFFFQLLLSTIAAFLYLTWKQNQMVKIFIK